MRRSRLSSRRTLGAAFVAACLSLASGGVAAQTPPTPAGGNGFELEQNYPNPFNPETTIPFTLGQELFVDGRPAVVSVRIFNLLTQPVAYSTALGHPEGLGVEVRNLVYAQPGRYEAFWDGTDQSGREVASGIYFIQLTVNGQSVTRRMLIQK
jgi:hypothetical protein